MNTPVNFELALSLRNKEFNEPCIRYYNTTHDISLCYVDLFGFVCEKTIEDYHINSENTTISAPTIADVVMWLYEKQGIWISVDPENDTDTWFHTISYNKSETVFGDYNTPTEAYEAAIEHCLKNII